jgi:hypothetical protein
MYIEYRGRFEYNTCIRTHITCSSVSYIVRQEAVHSVSTLAVLENIKMQQLVMASMKARKKCSCVFSKRFKHVSNTDAPYHKCPKFFSVVGYMIRNPHMWAA